MTLTPMTATTSLGPMQCRQSCRRTRRRAPVVAASPELLEELAEYSRRLDGASPQEIIAWAVEQYFPKLTMATAFGPEGCVIIHMLAEIEPRTHVFNLDTGYQFKETLELRDRIAKRYGIEVELQARRHDRGASTKRSTADRCTRRIPTSAASTARSRCCARRSSAGTPG